VGVIVTAVLPLMPLFAVSATRTVRLPAVVSVSVKVCTPLSVVLLNV
jgi:hypothetical protein